jgi:hypothetical protein
MGRLFGKAIRRQSHKPGEMNRTELKYSEYLTFLLRSGEILDWSFESEKLRLADRTFYTPDFMVMNKDKEIEFHEVKGFMRDDANVKIKVAAELHPYRFKLIKLVRGKFEVTEI